MPARAELARWLRHSFLATEPGLHNLRGIQIDTHTAHHVSAGFDYGGHMFQGRAEVSALRQGPQVVIFVAAAASNDFERQRPRLTRILMSARLAAAPGLAWVPEPRRALISI